MNLHFSRSARSRRRGGLKRAAGKKGTVFEEMYLLRSLKKTVENKMEELQSESLSSKVFPDFVTLGRHSDAFAISRSSGVAARVALAAEHVASSSCSRAAD